jgi:hypothetical protein
VAQQEHADLLDEIGVRQEVVEHVRVHAATGEHADRPGEPLGHVSRGLQRLPRTLQEVTMLGIHDRRVAGSDTEEGGVEHLQVGEDPVALHVVGVVQQAIGNALGPESVVVQVGEAVVAGHDATPERVDIGRAGEAPGHADDGDVRVGDLGAAIVRSRGGVDAHQLDPSWPPRRARARRRMAPRSVPVGAATTGAV